MASAAPFFMPGPALPGDNSKNCSTYALQLTGASSLYRGMMQVTQLQLVSGSGFGSGFGFGVGIHTYTYTHTRIHAYIHAYARSFLLIKRIFLESKIEIKK